MNIKINSQKSEIIVTASGSERSLLNLIAIFAGPAIKNVPKSRLEKLTSSFIDKLVIDMSNDTITKEFIQLLLRLK